MARYTYNAGLVTQTLEQLNDACKSLDKTNVDIKKGIDMINSARGAENISVDFTPIIGYKSSAIEYIELMTKEIKGKAQEIEEYQDAPWYKKLFATIGMGALKLVEGLATFVENIGDGLVSIVGFIGGIFSSEFKNSVAEFVRTDYVGETTAKWYEEGWLKDVNKYSVMSHQSTAANVLKGFGTAAGYVILTVATAGIGGAAAAGSAALTAGTYITAGAAAVGGIGSGTQNALKQAQLANPNMSAGDAFNSAFGQGVKQGAIAAGTTLATAGLSKALVGAKMTGKGVQLIDDVVNNADDVAKLTKTAKIINSAKKGINTIGNKIFNNKAGLAFIEGVQTLGESSLGAALINSSAPVIGAVASGQFKKNNETVKIDQELKEPPTPGEILKKKLKESPHPPSPPQITEIKNAEQPTQDEIEQTKESTVVTPKPTNPQPTKITPRPTTPQPTRITPRPSTPQPTRVTPEPTTPRPTPTTGQPNPTTTRPQPTTTRPQPTTTTRPQPTTTRPTITQRQDDIIRTLSPTNKPSYVNDTGSKSSGVLDTFGQVSGSLSDITGTSTSIPSSSSPILSSDGGSGSSMIPLGAGLGAAALAGIGTKAYLDKKEKKEEDSDELETEEWANQDVEIDYGLETDEEADYLDPTDELAFQE